MPRRARLALGGIPWHVIQRGNNRSMCFFCATDYRRYLDTLFEQAHEFNCSLHAYVLMTNHVHLLLTPKDKEGVGLLMKSLGQRYVQYINRTYNRSGTLWDGRYKSTLVQSRTYVLACYRYIEMNPVRAGIVDHPGKYQWSSYNVNGEGEFSGGIVPHEEYLTLGRNDKSRLSSYKDLFNSDLHPQLIDKIRQYTNSNYALGNNRFQDEIGDALSRRAKPGIHGRPWKRN